MSRVFWFYDPLFGFAFLLLFFFFKQKTAYEMRISDWSSDVCSSDLPVTVQDAGRLDRLRQGASRRPVVCVGGRGQFGAPGHRGAEIGRASCRERVCQYV